MDQFESREILQLIKDHLSIRITTFSASYLQVELAIDGVAFDSDSIDVPGWEIREGVD